MSELVSVPKNLTWLYRLDLDEFRRLVSITGLPDEVVAVWYKVWRTEMNDTCLWRNPFSVVRDKFMPKCSIAMELVCYINYKKSVQARDLVEYVGATVDETFSYPVSGLLKPKIIRALRELSMAQVVVVTNLKYKLHEQAELTMGPFFKGSSRN